MESPDPESKVESTTDPTAQAATGSANVLWKILFTAGLAGLAGGVALDQTRNKFDRKFTTYSNPTPEQTIKFNRERQAALRFSVAASTGIAGACMAGVIGLGFGLVRRSAIATVSGLTIGTIAGTGLVGVGGMAGQHYYAVVSTSGAQPSLLHAIVIQLTFWIPLVVAVGLAVGWRGKFVGFLQTNLVLLGAGMLASVAVPILTAILIVLTPQNTRDAIPPDTLSYCLFMTIPGTILVGFLLWKDLLDDFRRTTNKLA